MPANLPDLRPIPSLRSTPAALGLAVALTLAALPTSAEAQARTVRGNAATAQAQATPGSPPKQKPASDLIQKQAKPKVVPRVLERANTENTRILVSLGKQRAYLMVDDEIAIDTPVSTGKRSARTPAGNFSILQKNANHRSSLYGHFVNRSGQIVRSGVSTKVDSAPSGTTFQGAPMRYFMRLTWDGIGLHVGELPGYPASHGCIRLPADIAQMIFQRVKVGTPVTIED